ncbi:MAG TPA: outer membrane protein transport protein [Verrucomicrobiae bacterium]|nr:outer membrane protein transport protein [Verrucomicrobiae bacterium]
MGKYKGLAIGILCSICAVSGPSVFALGFRNPDQDARATAQGEAFVAQADDASAIYYNPAGLTQVKGTQITLSGDFLFRNVKFRGPSGSDNLDTFSLTPNFFAATDFGLQHWRFGLGVYIPFGNRMDWGSGPFSSLIRQSELIVYDFAPTVAYQFNDHFSLGAGVNFYHGNTDLKFDYLPPSSPYYAFFPQSRSEFMGDGDGIGATVGAMWKINEQHTIGAVYRSPFSINFQGNARNTDAGSFDARADASAEIKFPQEVAVGYAFRPIKKLKLEADVEWTNWENLDNVRLHSNNPIITGDPRSNIPFHWRDSFFYEGGAQYDLTDHWALRAGYIYSENSVPTSTFSPVLPDSNKHIFSAGFGYDSKGKAVLFSKAALRIDVAYQYTLALDRNVGTGVSPLVDGKWESSSHAVVLTSTVRF